MLIAKCDDRLDSPFLEGLFAGSNVDTLEGITEPYRATGHEPQKGVTPPSRIAPAPTRRSRRSAREIF
jgi:hypothetical protein